MSDIDKSIGFIINYTTRNMRRYATDVLKREGLDITVDQWGIIQMLNEANAPINHTALSDKMLKDKPTLTRIVDILVKKDLVERLPSPSDRRALLLQLTKKGHQKVKEATPIVDEIRNTLSANITDKEMDQLKGVLDKINRSIS